MVDGSLASRADLREGDLVQKLGGLCCVGMRHKQAQETIIGAGNKLTIIVKRYALYIS